MAQAIDGTDESEAIRLAAEFNNSFGHLIRASVDVESVQGDHTSVNRSEGRRTRRQSEQQEMEDGRGRYGLTRPSQAPANPELGMGTRVREAPSSSSEDLDVKKLKKKKSKKGPSIKKTPKSSDSSSDSDHSSSSPSSDSDDSDDSSRVEEAELCYEITDFESADLPDLPEKWDKGFRKLRSYVPLTLFKTTLLESF